MAVTKLTFILLCLCSVAHVEAARVKASSVVMADMADEALDALEADPPKSLCKSTYIAKYGCQNAPEDGNVKTCMSWWCTEVSVTNPLVKLWKEAGSNSTAQDRVLKVAGACCSLWKQAKPLEVGTQTRFDGAAVKTAEEEAKEIVHAARTDFVKQEINRINSQSTGKKDTPKKVEEVSDERGVEEEVVGAAAVVPVVPEKTTEELEEEIYNSWSSDERERQVQEAVEALMTAWQEATQEVPASAMTDAYFSGSKHSSAFCAEHCEDKGVGYCSSIYTIDQCAAAGVIFGSPLKTLNPRDSTEMRQRHGYGCHVRVMSKSKRTEWITKASVLDQREKFNDEVTACFQKDWEG